MKRALFAIAFMFTATLSISQNIGIGELSPGAKLTIKGPADGIGKSLMVKTASNDTSFFIQGNKHYVNGFTNSTPSSFVIGNKYFPSSNIPQLSILAWGEVSTFQGASTSKIEFANVNNPDSRFEIRSYTGTEFRRYWSVSLGSQPLFNYNPLIEIGENGHIGFGTYTTFPKVQINHLSVAGSPTLNLVDSSANGGPVLQFTNREGTGTAANRWQIKTSDNRMDFLRNGISIATMNLGFLGIGTDTPYNDIQIYGGGSSAFTQYTNSATGSASGDGLLVGTDFLGNGYVLNQETTPLNFGVSGFTRMTLTSAGFLGIGDTSPSERLEVSGNAIIHGTITLSGELNKQGTGTSNLLPIAYGNISATGSISQSSGNFSVAKTGVGDYEITITNVNYHYTLFATLVTPAGNSTPVFANANSVNGHLLVNIMNVSGVSVDSRFSFVVYGQ